MSKIKKVVTAMLLASSVSFVTLLSADSNSYKMDFNKETTCLVRHFKVYKHPMWVAKIELANSKKLYFSSPKSMLEFYLHPGKWYNLNVRSEDDFKDIIVTDFSTGKPIDARGAFYVFGSSKTSPAGDDLIPFSSYEKAKKFSKENNGKRILNFKEIPLNLINLLNGIV